MARSPAGVRVDPRAPSRSMRLAAQLSFGLVHNAPGLGVRHAHALGGAVERVLAGDALQQ